MPIEGKILVPYQREGDMSKEQKAEIVAEMLALRLVAMAEGWRTEDLNTRLEALRNLLKGVRP